jgi:hypothetical protein
VVILQAFAGKISLGDVTFYTSAVGSVQGALSGIVYALANVNESTLFFSRYLDLLALPQPIVIPADPHPSRLKQPLSCVTFHFDILLSIPGCYGASI